MCDTNISDPYGKLSMLPKKPLYQKTVYQKADQYIPTPESLIEIITLLTNENTKLKSENEKLTKELHILKSANQKWEYVK
jgi:hypothetical protein